MSIIVIIIDFFVYTIEDNCHKNNWLLIISSYYTYTCTAKLVSIVPFQREHNIIIIIYIC